MSIDSKEKVQDPTLARAEALAVACLEEVANMTLQEAFFPDPEQETARDFYAKDMPDRTLVPQGLLEIYRLQALAETLDYDADPIFSDQKHLLEAELSANTTREVFPFAPYSLIARSYLVTQADLEKMFSSDLLYNYPDRIERKE